MVASLYRTDLYFTIDGTTSHAGTPSIAQCAWKFPTVLELTKPAPTRGTDAQIMPDADGRIANALFLDANTITMNGEVFGVQQGDGTPAGGSSDMDELICLYANLQALVAAWAVLPATDDSTRTCVVHCPDGTTHTGPIQVQDFDWDYTDMPTRANVVMKLYLPAGFLPVDP